MLDNLNATAGKYWTHINFKKTKMMMVAKKISGKVSIKINEKQARISAEFQVSWKHDDGR
jgi:hypothetical protein